MKFTKAVKVTANLTNCAKNEEAPQHVFVQTKGDVISFYASLPETGYYKFQLFALPLPDDSTTLVGVYNYLINCKKITSAAVVYPKQFAQWKQGCFIKGPLSLHQANSLTDVQFGAFIPNASAVAVVAEGRWSNLTKVGDAMWEGRVDLEEYRGKDAKVTLNANYGEESKYATLLEYRV